MTRLLSSVLLALSLAACGSSGGSDGAGDAAGDAAEVMDMDGGMGPCLCEPDEHCDDAGVCVPNVCVPATSVCVTTQEVQHCDAIGASFTLADCEAGSRCDVGVCVPIICEPEVTTCQLGYKMRCNSLGTKWVPVPCPETHVCQAGECHFVQPNILLLVDTSFSMNRMVGTDQTPAACTGEAGCPPWTYPDCDDPESPVTRLGVVKEILQDLTATSEEAGLRLALQRFPQSAAAGGTCFNGHYGSLDAMTGDNGARNTVGEDWFQIYLSETVIVPFEVEGGSAAEAIVHWVDFEESTIDTGGSCDTDADCPGGLCWLGGCKVHEAEELRGMGQTPLGKSLFYAGEYLRHAVFVEGRSCAVDADCASPHHQCVEGACHDPLGKCRSTRVILFTDGVESANHDLDDFYHPRVQAKRLHHGLGCDALDECVGGATCEGGICRAPEGTAEVGDLACAVYEIDCATDADCPEFPCGSGQSCPGQCREAMVNLVDGDDGDRLTDAAGRPVSVQVHVVDASGIEGANRYIAAYGGGVHVSVDLGAASTIVATVLPLLDAKVSPDGEVCDLEAE